MNKTLIIFLILLATIQLHSQDCKFFKPGSTVFNRAENIIGEKLTSHTKQKTIYSKFKNKDNGLISLAANDDHYFFRLSLVRQYSNRFKITKDEILEIVFDDESSVKLKSFGLYEGKGALTSFTMDAFYVLTKEQLDKLALLPIKSLKIYFISDTVTQFESDESGKYLRYDILSENYKNNALELARCIQ